MQKQITAAELPILLALLRRAVWETTLLLAPTQPSVVRLDTAALAYRRLLQELKAMRMTVVSYARNNSNAAVAWEARSGEWTVNYRRLVPTIESALEEVRALNHGAA